MKGRLLILLILFTLHIGCLTDKDTIEDCNEVDFNTSLYQSGEIDPNTWIDGFEIVENCLELKVSYPGGCEEHQLDLAAIGWIKTDPPKIEAKIIHDNTDLCEALITQYLRFDLEPLRYGDEDELIIILEGLDQEILHKYID